MRAPELTAKERDKEIKSWRPRMKKLEISAYRTAKETGIDAANLSRYLNGTVNPSDRVFWLLHGFLVKLEKKYQ